MFDRLCLTDPLSQARMRPGYAKELNAWRSTLRPFLCPGGILADEQPLHSCSKDVEMCQTAIDVTAVGILRRREYCESFDWGRGATNRPSRPPHFLTVAEQKHFDSDARRTTACLRAEFNSLLAKVPDDVASADLCASFEGAKTKDCVLQCVLVLRNLVESLSLPEQE